MIVRKTRYNLPVIYTIQTITTLSQHKRQEQDIGTKNILVSVSHMEYLPIVYYNFCIQNEITYGHRKRTLLLNENNRVA